MMEIDDIVTELREKFDQDELFEMIKQLDKDIADYNFTKALRDHFIDQVEDEYDIDSED